MHSNVAKWTKSVLHANILGEGNIHASWFKLPWRVAALCLPPAALNEHGQEIQQRFLPESIGSCSSHSCEYFSWALQEWLRKRALKKKKADFFFLLKLRTPLDVQRAWKRHEVLSQALGSGTLKVCKGCRTHADQFAWFCLFITATYILLTFITPACGDTCDVADTPLPLWSVCLQAPAILRNLLANTHTISFDRNYEGCS